MCRSLPVMFLVAALCLTSPADSQNGPKSDTLARLPVQEVTVFKDGHAFVVHEGALPVDGNGSVSLDNLPTPVLGTFWPYSSTPAARLNAVTAAVRRPKIERIILDYEGQQKIGISVSRRSPRVFDCFKARIVLQSVKAPDYFVLTAYPD